MDKSQQPSQAAQEPPEEIIRLVTRWGWDNNFLTQAQAERVFDWVDSVFAPAGADLNAVPAPTGLPPKADWSQAPDWAVWWCVDASGFAYWHEDEPERDLEDVAWSSSGQITDDIAIDIPLGTDWRLLKERRPT